MRRLFRICSVVPLCCPVKILSVKLMTLSSGLSPEKPCKHAVTITNKRAISLMDFFRGQKRFKPSPISGMPIHIQVFDGISFIDVMSFEFGGETFYARTSTIWPLKTSSAFWMSGSFLKSSLLNGTDAGVFSFAGGLSRDGREGCEGVFTSPTSRASRDT